MHIFLLRRGLLFKPMCLLLNPCVISLTPCELIYVVAYEHFIIQTKRMKYSRNS